MPLENFTYLPDEYSVSQESIDSLCQRISRLRQAEPTAYIIVSPHWGIEHRVEPAQWQRRQARALIDAGADIIVGHHTHTLQTIENYKGKPIYYSIGNFIFDQQKPLNTRACIVRLRVTAEKIWPMPFPFASTTRHPDAFKSICRFSRSPMAVPRTHRSRLT